MSTSEYQVLPRPADEAAWLEMRKPYSNASSAAVHVREHEYETIADWFVAKRTGVSKEETRAMTRGKELEAAVCEWYAREQGLIISGPLDVLFVRGRLMGTPDRRVIGRENGPDQIDRVNEIIEAKASPGKRGQRSRYWQCIALLAASDADAVHLVELLPGDYRPTFLARSEPQVAADIERLMAAIDDDWLYLDLGIPPPDAVFDAEQAFSVWPIPGVAKVELDTAGRDAALDLKAARAMGKIAEQAEKTAKATLANLMRDAEMATYAGVPIISWKANKPSMVVDAAAVAREVPAVIARHTFKKDGARQMRVIGEPPAEPTESEVGF